EEPGEAPAEEPSEPPQEEPAEAPPPEEPGETPPEPAAARAKPEIPGADLEVDIVPEGFDPLTGRPIEAVEAELAEAETPEGPVVEEAPEEPRPVAQVAIDLAAGARYRATGKRKSAVARVIL